MQLSELGIPLMRVVADHPSCTAKFHTSLAKPAPSSIHIMGLKHGLNLDTPAESQKDRMSLENPHGFPPHPTKTSNPQIFQDQRSRAVWSPEVEYLVEMGCVKPLVDLLAVSDAKIIGVALEALENILKAHWDRGFWWGHEVCKTSILMAMAQLVYRGFIVRLQTGDAMGLELYHLTMPWMFGDSTSILSQDVRSI